MEAKLGQENILRMRDESGDIILRTQDSKFDLW